MAEHFVKRNGLRHTDVHGMHQSLEDERVNKAEESRKKLHKMYKDSEEVLAKAVGIPIGPKQ